MPLEPQPHTRAGLDAAWALLGATGTWWTGAQKLALASETRAARGCALCAERRAALSPRAVDGAHEATKGLSAAAVDAVHRISSDPGRLSEKWYRQLLASGLAPEELVEAIGVVGVVTLADTLSLALDLPRRLLPEAQPGEPTRERPAGLEVSGGWVPMVAPDRAEGAVRAMYASVEGAAGFVFNVARALTAVPAALRSFFAAFLPNYNTHGEVPPGGLSRSQVEVLSSSTSALNDCFY